MNNKKVIAYLAPEVPALSATFVYQEILELKRQNIDVRSVSIHRPKNKALSEELRKLESETFYLYEQSFLTTLFFNILLFISKPFRYLSIFKVALTDSLKVGITSHIGRGILYRFVIAASFVKYLKENNIEHIHANFAHIPTDVAMYAAELHGIPFSFISHANDLFERGWLLKEKIARAKFAVTISAYNKQFLIDKGADESKINVIHCGVDTASFNERDEKELSKPPILGSLGRMVEKKGFDALISACNILKREGVEFKVQIAGGGPLKSELENLARKLDVEDSIVFIDSISHEDVPDWIKSLDFFVLPCKKDVHGDLDGIPVVLMEAMLSGVPVITSHISGIPELIKDDLTGCLCKPDDAACLAKKIRTLFVDQKLRRTLIRNAGLKVKTEFELSSNVKKLSVLLDKSNN